MSKTFLQQYGQPCRRISTTSTNAISAGYDFKTNLTTNMAVKMHRSKHFNLNSCFLHVLYFGEEH